MTRISVKKFLPVFVLIAVPVIGYFALRGYFYSFSGRQTTDTTQVRHYIEQGLQLIPEPGFTTESTDKALALAVQAQALSLRSGYQEGIGKSYYLKGYAYLLKNRQDSARTYLRQAISVFEKLGRYRALADSYSRLSQTYPIEQDIQQRMKCLEEAQRYYDLSGSFLEQGNSLSRAGELYMLAADYLKAQRLLNNALVCYKRIGYNNVASTYDLLNQVHVGLGNYPKALDYGLHAVRTAREVNDTGAALCTFYNRRGIPQLFMGHLADAIHSFDTALHIAMQYRDTASFMIVVKNLAHANNKAGRLDDCLRLLLPVTTFAGKISREEKNAIDFFILSAYNGKKDMSHAEAYYLSLLHSIPDNSSSAYELYAYVEMIRYKMRFGKFDEARTLSDKAATLYSSHKLFEALKSTYRLKYEIDSTQGRLAAAVESYKKFKNMSDSLLLMQREAQVKNLEKQFSSEVALQDELEEQKLALLHTQGNLQAAALKQAKAKNYMLYAGILLLMGLLTGGYRVYVLKQRSTNMLQKQKTAIDQQNESLKRLIDQQVKLIQEKEWLVKEVHHRVKNNLQIIVSLLNFQAKVLKDESAISAIRNSQNRVKAMAFLHQRLYQSDTLKYVDVAKYVKELTKYLRDAMHTSVRLTFIHQINAIDLDIAQMVPLGLIINEAVTNSIKYAFTGREQGQITITFDYDTADTFRLTIADDGMGLPPGFDWDSSLSLGTSLIQSMAEQLEADFTYKSQNGLQLTFVFRQEQGQEESIPELINEDSYA